MLRKDRRRSVRSSPGRRQSERIPDYRTVWWQVRGQDGGRCGWLVDWSAHGIALITEKQDTPSVGDILIPRQRPDVRGWQRPAAVRRVRGLSELLNLVAAEIVETPSPPDVSSRAADPPRGGSTPVNGRTHNGERRRSLRWPINATLAWRLARGRVIHISPLIERSRRDIVLLNKGKCRLKVDQRLVPGDPRDSRFLGFREAVVRRVQDAARGGQLVVARIES